jgi:hypothetical protein
MERRSTRTRVRRAPSSGAPGVLVVSHGLRLRLMVLGRTLASCKPGVDEVGGVIFRTAGRVETEGVRLDPRHLMERAAHTRHCSAPVTGERPKGHLHRSADLGRMYSTAGGDQFLCARPSYV